MALVDMLENQGGCGKLWSADMLWQMLVHARRQSCLPFLLIKSIAASTMHPGSATRSNTLVSGHCSIFRPFTKQVRTLWAQILREWAWEWGYYVTVSGEIQKSTSCTAFYHAMKSRLTDISIIDYRLSVTTLYTDDSCFTSWIDPRNLADWGVGVYLIDSSKALRRLEAWEGEGELGWSGERIRRIWLAV